MRLSIVMPCYNEGDNLPVLVRRVSEVILKDMELVLVDNGSTDGSAKILSELKSKSSFLKVVTIKKNIGYGNGIMSGVKAAKGDFIGWTHADMQTDPYDLIKALKLIEKRADSKNCFVKGSRKKRAFIDSFFTLGMSVFCSVMLGKTLFDINAQPKLFHRSFLSRLKDAPDDFSLDLFAFYTAKKHNMKIVLLPVTFEKRLHGISSWNHGFSSRVKFIRRTIEYTIKLKKRLLASSQI